MSEAEDSFNALCQTFESQGIEEGGPSLTRRESENSDTSQTSTMAGTRKRTRLQRLPRPEGVEPPTGKRPVYPKVRTGCDTCKQRKIKCDETKPICRNCIKSDRQCLGYHPPTPKIFQPSRPSRQDPENEARLLNFFTTVVAERLSHFKELQLELSFWQTVVPTLAKDCPPLRHAMLAFAAIQERYDTRHPTDVTTTTIAATDVYFALEQYTEVLRKVNSGITAASITTNGTLICCLLLSLCDMWHFGGSQSFKHVFGGLELCKIVKKISPAKSPLPETTEINGAMLVPAFQYLADCATLDLDEPTEEQRLLLKDFEDGIDPVLPSNFGNIHLAYAAMERALLQIGKAFFAVESVRFKKLFDLQGHLNALQITLEDSLRSSQNDQDKLHLRTLLLHERMASILTDVSLADSEAAYDSNIDEFELIIAEAEDLISLSRAQPLPGIVSLLFLTATKCRVTTLRKKALELLHNSQQLERSWTSCTAHQIAQHVVALEMQGRIELTAVRFDVALRQIQLTFLREHDKVWEQETSCLPWCRDEDQISAVHKTESYTMQKLIRVGGYSALPWAYRQHKCHCGEG